MDRVAMKRERDFDLKNYDEVRARAAKILERLERGDMPCDASWPPDRVQLFKLVRTRKAWIAPFATVVRIDWEAATAVNSANTWTPKALAELVEGLGGHSQSGSMGHHMARILKEHGKLHLLKGLITIEGGCSLTNAGLAADGSDFKTIAYMAFKGDYTAPSAGCLATVNAIKAIGGKADNIELDQAGWWQGNYAGPFGNDYVGRRLAHDDD
jgi:hypothetical protein